MDGKIRIKNPKKSLGLENPPNTYRLKIPLGPTTYRNRYVVNEIVTGPFDLAFFASTINTYVLYVVSNHFIFTHFLAYVRGSLYSLGNNFPIL